jgi:hypothetical protein
MSLHPLRNKSLAVYEIAFLLGYSDPGALYSVKGPRYSNPYRVYRARAGASAGLAPVSRFR